MGKSEAEQIAALLNSRNGLKVTYDAQLVQRSPEQFPYCTQGTHVVAAVCLKEVQWYQGEVCHLSVAAELEGRGYARNLWPEVERRAGERGFRILQCTIREGYENGERFFDGAGFSRVARFRSEISGGNLCVWQKVLVPARPVT
jgi:ribosomal protein S18 acetylase RimI-like enzyme